MNARLHRKVQRKFILANTIKQGVLAIARYQDNKVNSHTSCAVKKIYGKHDPFMQTEWLIGLGIPCTVTHLLVQSHHISTTGLSTMMQHT